MNVDITSPPENSTVAGMVDVTVNISPLTDVTEVRFAINDFQFASLPPAPTVTATLDTIGLGVPNGNNTINVSTVGASGFDSQKIIVNNPSTIAIQNVTGTIGGNVVARVRLNQISRAARFRFRITWDPSKLQLDTNSTLMSDISMPGSLEVIAAGTKTFTNTEMMTAEFKILAPPSSGAFIPIGMPTASVATTAGAPIDVTPRGGVVAIL